MPLGTRTRSALASLIGWALVVVVAIVVIGFVLRTVFWVIRTALVVLLIGGLLIAYLSLKGPPDGDG